MKALSKYKLLFILFVATIILVIIAALLRSAPALPSVIRTDPAPGESFNYYDPLIVSFDQAIDPTLLTVTSDPKEEWVVVLENNLTARLEHPKYLQVATPYKIFLNYSGQPLYEWEFEVIPQQSDPRYVQEVNNQLARDYPLSLKIPYSTNNYSVIYSSPLSLSITRKNNILSDEEILTEVRDFVESQGVDPSSHHYSIVADSPIKSP